MSRNERLGRYGDVASALALPSDRRLGQALEAVAPMIRRYAPVAAAVNDFYRDLYGTSRTTPYPGERIERALKAMSRARLRPGGAELDQRHW
ncbi:hypothetical protein [Nonomuraea sp. NPDC052265]|uniref:hypothetical protein n=1 Tax=Nonomuraea sp. NPDC052265 TaxID=3364374 RepID=UPI0037C56A53